MSRLTPQKAQARRTRIEATLRSMRPIESQTGLWDLYRSAKGYYIVRYDDGDSILYLAITSDGGLHDMVGYEVDGGDRTAALVALRGAGLHELAEKTKNWGRSPQE